MADAYEAQALELEAAQARIAELDTAMQQANSAAVAHQAAFDQVRTELDRAHLVAAEQRNAAGQARENAANLRGRLAAFESVATSPALPKAGQAKPRGRGAS
ncbi:MULTISPECIES: hypothetical protein [Xanthomonas]|uniref:hypothetical protein n=1 Tax=Xanthomonas TaxID=338 RepID=UPI00355832AC